MFIRFLILQLFLTSNCLFGIGKKKLSEAEELLLSYKDEYFWTIVSNADGTHIAARACYLQYKPDFGFYICAKNDTNKYEQLKANPYATLSFAKVTDNSIPVFYATCRVSTNKADIDKAWFAKMKDYGYTGKDDPRLVVFIFTIHGASLGPTKNYSGVSYDFSNLRVVGDAPLPTLQTEGPFQSVEGLGVLIDAWKKDPRGFHLFTFNGLEVRDRLMRLNYNNKTGFYLITSPSSGKAAQLSGNPNVALLQEQRSENVQVVVDGLLHEVKCVKAKEDTWDDSFKVFGFTGYQDPDYGVYKLVVRKVIVHSFTAAPKVYQFEPTAYDNATHLLYSAWKAGHVQWGLSTVDARNVPHSRTMLLSYHSALGFYMGGRNSSEKYKQLAHQHAAALNLYVVPTGEDYQVQVDTRILDLDPVRYAIRTNKLKSINYTGPENESQQIFADKKTIEEFLPFSLNIRSLTYRPSKTVPPTAISICKTPGTGTGAAAAEAGEGIKTDVSAGSGTDSVVTGGGGSTGIGESKGESKGEEKENDVKGGENEGKKPDL